MSRWCARFEQRLLRLDLGIEVGAERHGRIGETLEHIDYDKRRPLAETDLDAETALAEEFLIFFAAGHDPCSSCRVRI